MTDEQLLEEYNKEIHGQYAKYDKLTLTKLIESHRHLRQKNKGSYFDVLCRYGKRSSNPVVVSKYNWDVVPGRDEEWKENIISMIGKENFEREYVV